jgi:acetyl/propionyl-CoA carboxylase alpha subunit
MLLYYRQLIKLIMSRVMRIAGEIIQLQEQEVKTPIKRRARKVVEDAPASDLTSPQS